MFRSMVFLTDNFTQYDYIEFRFGNIYDALNFKRELSTGEEWEHCTIGHTEDPCESATGVHTDD